MKNYVAVGHVEEEVVSLDDIDAVFYDPEVRLLKFSLVLYLRTDCMVV